jgi:hypothetical protein
MKPFPARTTGASATRLNEGRTTPDSSDRKTPAKAADATAPVKTAAETAYRHLTVGFMYANDTAP